MLAWALELGAAELPSAAWKLELAGLAAASWSRNRSIDFFGAMRFCANKKSEPTTRRNAIKEMQSKKCK